MENVLQASPWIYTRVATSVHNKRLGRVDSEAASKRLLCSGVCTQENVFSPCGEAMRPDDLEAVQVSGKVSLSTAFGLFLDVEGRRLFVPSPMVLGKRRFKRGQTVTVWLTRGYLKQQGFPDV
jgi:hypothetical protein